MLNIITSNISLEVSVQECILIFEKGAYSYKYKSDRKKRINAGLLPAGTCRLYNVALMSMQRHVPTVLFLYINYLNIITIKPKCDF